MNPPDPSADSSLNSGVLSASSQDPLVILHLPVSTRLTRTNFLAWKSQIIPLLHGHKLQKYLISSPPPDSIVLDGKSVTNPAHDHWCQQDQLILAWLRSSLSESILGEVVSSTTTA